MSRTFRATRFLVPLALLCLAGSARAQSPVTISGQIADSTSKRPLVGAEITVLRDADGTLAGSARAGESGRYTLVTNTTGLVTVRVRLVGYTQQQRRLTLVAGQTFTANFNLAERLMQLDQVVVTGTAGVTQRRAVGNVVSTIDASKVLEIAPARSVNELIGARTPGLIVLPSTGQVGTGGREEKIRTYNYPQNRVTDHRIGITLYNLDRFMEGDITEMLNALQAADMADRLEAASTTQS